MSHLEVELTLKWLLFAATMLPLLSFFFILCAYPWAGKAFGSGGWISVGAIFMSGVLSFIAMGVWLTKNPPQASAHGGHHGEEHGDHDHDHDHDKDKHGHDGDSHDNDANHGKDSGEKTTSTPSGERTFLSASSQAFPITLAGYHEESEEESSESASDEPENTEGAEAGEHDARGPPYSGEYYLLGKFGNLRLEIGYYIDALTLCMFCMVTLIATCIHVYATGYMHEELHDVTDHEVTLSDGSHLHRPGRYFRFFQYLSLFSFSMLGLVLAGNVAMVFVFWELVGICSYFLIGFYVERKSASNAANKAFIVNRVGDFGMLIGLMAIWSSLGTFAFGNSERSLELGDVSIASYEQQLEEGWVPVELRDELKRNGVQLPQYVFVDSKGDGMWRIGGFSSNEPSILLASDEDHLSVVIWENGVFSQVRPSSDQHPYGPDHAHELIVPDGMLADVGAVSIGRIVEDHIRAGQADVSNQNSKAQILSQSNVERERGSGRWLLFIAGVGIFCGCVGKSAQFPLHVWLPDAMEGPTPVSALVHSATMVAAGVYLVGRFYPVFTPEALLVIATVGVITLFMAATIAITATDIKRVLAYSTISQLGYMMLALGLGGWLAGMMHLVTHAFFKSLLFLCSGSVIHAVHTNEMPQMGGLLKKMPVTAITMLIGCLAIAGASIPFVVGLSGYYSKDAILEQAFNFWQTNSSPFAPMFFVLAAGGAAITAFYMFRLWFLTFLGAPRDKHRYEHAHESPKAMYVPLMILAVFAVCVAWNPFEHQSDILGGVIALVIFALIGARYWMGTVTDHHSPSPGNLCLAAVIISVGVILLSMAFLTNEQPTVLANLLDDARPDGTEHGFHKSMVGLVWPNEHELHLEENFWTIKFPVTMLAFATGIAGIFVAAMFYWFRVLDPQDVRNQFKAVYHFLLGKWWFDELYDFIFVRPTHVISRVVANIDRGVIDRLIDGLAWLTTAFSKMWDAVADRTIVDGSVNLFAKWTYSVGLALRRMQRGHLREYVMFIVLGTIVLFVLISFLVESP